jgi:hypothetical protein
VSAARDTLAMLAQRAGYNASALEFIASAAVPGFVPGQRLDEPQVEQVAQAVIVLAQGGATNEHVPVLVDGYRERFGDSWRDQFWETRLRIANSRYRQPEVYGLSPCHDLAEALIADRQPALAPPAAQEPPPEAAPTPVADADEAPWPTDAPPAAPEPEFAPAIEAPPALTLGAIPGFPPAPARDQRLAA